MLLKRLPIAGAWCLGLTLSTFPAFAQNTGSIYTSIFNGTDWIVNANVISDPHDVYLNGGPHNQNASGLPLGDYYFQVTDPSGKVLLSTDDISCRTVHVQANGGGNGVIYGVPAGALCFHPDALSLSLPLDANGGNPVQLFPFTPTPNNGGVYKVWLTKIADFNPDCTDESPSCKGSFGFVPSKTKTDNFKIKCDPDGCENFTVISGIKYHDSNVNGKVDPGEMGLGDWQINVTVNGVTTSVPLTDSDGKWSIPLPPNTHFIACEVLQTGWYQSGPEKPYPAGYPLPSGSASVNTTEGINCWEDTAGNADTAGYDFGNYQAQNLTVTKTAAPYFTRAYNWAITKSVDKTLVEQVGGTATFNYTVKASETGYADSDWQVTGKITVTNPNQLLDFNGVVVTDLVSDGGICIAGTVDVPAGKSVEVPYTCTFASAPSPLSGTNTATADWGYSRVITPNTTGSGYADFAFGSPTTTVNKTVTITDTFKGLLGTVTANDSSPYASAPYTYPRTVTVPANDTCVVYPNSATIVETGQSANQSVTVCGAVRGALTIGFWQNKNGQAIITGQAKTGVCPSATFLRTYLPFQDLSATATCAQTGTYVTNIIKAASSAGATENPMLKAQMLATALDVYFSSPAGGYKISSPVPLGGVKVDLTKICVMIDGSAGTATCSGTYKNVSGAFGGATSLTVTQMLLFENTVSNVGGSVWYGQVKAAQDLAKNAFDAINNAVAFVAP